MDFIIVIIVLIFGFNLKNKYKILNAYDHRIVDKLYFYHMLMIVVFYFYILTNGGDSYGYWKFSKTMKLGILWTEIVEGRASASFFIYLLCYLPAKVLNLSFFTGSMLFGVFGYWGVLLIYIILKEQSPLFYYLKNIKVLGISYFPTILFLPNLHFWSAGVGKDTVTFFTVCMFLYGICKLKERWLYIAAAAAICYPVRPHILLFLLSGFGVSYIIKSEIKYSQKLLIIIIGIIIFIPLLENVLDFAKIDEASLESFQEFGDKKAGLLNRDSGSGIDISSLPYPLQVFTFLYRPLFFDAPNALGIISSIENSIWMFLTILFLSNKPREIFRKNHFIVFASFLFWLIGALAFAPVLGNLGIIVRERNMFLPAFIILAIASISNSNDFKRMEYHLWQQYRNQNQE